MMHMTRLGNLWPEMGGKDNPDEHDERDNLSSIECICFSRDNSMVAAGLSDHSLTVRMQATRAHDTFMHVADCAL